MLQVENVAERLNLGRVIVVHQQNAGERQHREEVKADSPHAPGVTVAGRVAIDSGGMKMEKNVGENRYRASSRIGPLMLHPEDGFPNLGLLRMFEVFL